MENKYYTPDIEEFHVGFEYELKDMDEWKVQVHGSLESKDALTRFNAHVRNLDYLEYLTATIHNNPHNIRIKYLDKEDIESLGFEKCKNGSFVKNSNPRYCQWTITQWDNYRISIKFYHPDDSLGEIWFRGTIKNKSELKVLLKQLNIN